MRILYLDSICSESDVCVCMLAHACACVCVFVRVWEIIVKLNQDNYEYVSSDYGYTL